jgi:hypothetical protein
MKLDPSTAEYSSPPARNRRYRIPTDSGAADRKLRPIGRLEARSRSGPFFRVAIPIERPAQSPPERQDSGARVRNAPTVQVGPVAQALRVLFLRPNGALRRDRTECPIAAAHEGPRAAQNHAAGSGQPEQQNRRSVRLARTADQCSLVRSIVLTCGRVDRMSLEERLLLDTTERVQPDVGRGGRSSWLQKHAQCPSDFNQLDPGLSTSAHSPRSLGR